MGLKKILAGIVAAAALIAMSGCSAQSGSVAATVNGVVITEDSLNTSVAAFNEILSQDPRYDSSDSVSFVLTYQILGEMFGAALPQLGLGFTDADREDLWTSTFSPTDVEYPLWTDPRLTSMMRGYLDFNLTNMLAQSGSIDVQTVVAALNSLSVTVNPRHGSWNMDTWAITSNSASNPVGVLADPVVFPVPA